MSKLRIISSKSKQKQVIQKLHDLKVLDIIEHKKTEELDIGDTIENSEKVAELLVKIKSLLGDSDKDENNIKHKSKKLDLKEIEEEITEIETKIKSKKEEITDINKNLSKKKELLSKLEILNSLYLDLESYNSLNSISTFVGTINNKELVKKELENITQKFKLHFSENNKNKTIALFIEKNKEEQVLEILKNHGFVELNLDFIGEMKGLPLKQMNKINDEINIVDNQKIKLDHEIEKIKRDKINDIKIFYNFLNIEAEKAEAPLKFAQTNNTVMITGWVPQSKKQETIKEIEKITDNKIYFEDLELKNKESVPIKMKNNMLVKPFEFFMRLYTLPSYKEVDPSTLIFLTFPIFFGFMLGDALYGVITLLLFWSLIKVIPAGKDLLKSMMACSYWTILFGIIFGEYLGFERLTINGILYEFPRLINRMHGSLNIMGNDIHIVLVIGAIVGLVHINLSLLFGAINEYDNHGLKEAILAKLSWYVFEAGLAIVLLKLLGIVSFSMANYFGIALIIISIIMIYLGEGVQGLVEIPAIFSNMLSYLRLGAVGLASVGLAVVVNEQLAMPFIEKGGLFILVAILILILGHVINIALGIIGPFLHSIRLHYVEFFARFYKGGGKEYKPFGVK
ncbi:V-type ATP synthase subunit I [Candidatus Woesearchaeota archaeon]|nr:V-type ATP synthase subunit I [Candidatus Woesearchaeota archaeon]